MIKKNPLVPVKKQIKGKTPYQAIRWINPAEQKKKAKEYVDSRQKKSYVTRYISSHPYDTEIYTPDELRANLPKTEKGKQFYTGPDSNIPYAKKSVNVDMIKQVVEFHKPVNGCFAIAEKLDGGTVRFFTTDVQEKKVTKKFKKLKNITKNVDQMNSKISQLINSPNPKKSQLGVVLKMIMLYDLRVGTGGKKAGIIYEKIKTTDLKPGMVIRHSSWTAAIPPHKVVYMDKDKATLGLIPVLPGKEKYEGDKKNIPPGYTEFIREGHYGATTLEARHFSITDKEMWMDFVGKSGVRWKIKIEDKSVASKIREFFAGKAGNEKIFSTVKRKQVADWLSRYKVLPHDFRKYTGTKMFAEEINNYPQPVTQAELNKIEKEILTKISEKLYNTPGVVKSSYVDPTFRMNWRAGLLANIGTKVKVKEVSKSLFFILMDDDFQKARVQRSN